MLTLSNLFKFSITNQIFWREKKAKPNTYWKIKLKIKKKKNAKPNILPIRGVHGMVQCNFFIIFSIALYGTVWLKP